MKKVLIPMAVRIDERGDVVYFVRPTYRASLKRVGLEPVLVNCEFAEARLREAYEQCGGVLFMGGRDVSPRYYGEDVHEKTRVDEPDRDKLEMKILEWVKRDRKPYLGICRGEQILNVSCGGSLFQHLPERVVEEHSVGSYEQLGKIKHDVFLETGSCLATVLDREKIEVNTAHHQAVSKVGDGLRVVARSEGGVIESLESNDKDWFLLGVQWHPEAEENEISKKIFQTFANAVKE